MQTQKNRAHLLSNNFLTMETTRTRGKIFLYYEQPQVGVYFLLSFQLYIDRRNVLVVWVVKVFLPLVFALPTSKTLSEWGIFTGFGKKRGGKDEEKNWKIFMMLMVSGALWFRLNIRRIYTQTPRNENRDGWKSVEGMWRGCEKCGNVFLL